MRNSTETMRTIQLDYDQVWVFDGGRDARVRVLHGAAWLTEEGRAEDTVLGPGGQRRLGAGRTVVGGLAPSRLQVLESAAQGVIVPAGWLRRIDRGLRRAVARLQLGAPAGQAGGAGC